MIIIPVHCNDSDKDNDDDGDDDNDKYTNSNLISCNNHFILKAPFTLLLTHILSMGGGGVNPSPSFGLEFLQSLHVPIAKHISTTVPQ